jgi:hypothetical protein
MSLRFFVQFLTETIESSLTRTPSHSGHMPGNQVSGHGDDLRTRRGQAATAEVRDANRQSENWRTKGRFRFGT